MANYKDIHGTTVRNSAGNLDGAATGELFYDSTNLDFKYKYPNVTSAGSWRTGNALNTARQNLAAFGEYTASVAAGGNEPTTTDAAFYLGMLGEGKLASGLKLSRSLAEKALNSVGEKINLSAFETAKGILQISK